METEILKDDDDHPPDCLTTAAKAKNLNLRPIKSEPLCWVFLIL